MPEMRATPRRPETVDPEMLLPERFPSLPHAMRERFGAEAEDYDERISSWWTRVRRALRDIHFDVADPVNEVAATKRLLPRGVPGR